MKRAHRPYPKGITEIPATRPDPRADPQATQKITRQQLDEVLKRTKSGTRPIVRSEPRIEPVEEAALEEPRDDSPQITITKIESVELDVIDPASLPRPATPLAPRIPARAIPAAPTVVPRHSSRTLTQRFRSSPQLAFFAGLAIATFITLAAVIGFFAGRISGH